MKRSVLLALLVVGSPYKGAKPVAAQPQHSDPIPDLPPHVMSRAKWEQLQKQQQK